MFTFSKKGSSIEIKAFFFKKVKEKVKRMLLYQRQRVNDILRFIN